VHELPDETLLEGFGRGDREMTVAFVRRFQAKVFGVALAVSGDALAAEDLAQQTFEKAWRHGATFDPRRGSVPGWLSTIARNLAIDSVRVRRPVPVDAGELLRTVTAPGAGVDEVVVASESATELRAALLLLPPEQARAVVLSGIAGMSAREVSESEGIPLGTAKTRIRTAMGRLRLILQGTEVDRDG
jgi:RNA polymerase sigma-70 factor (ECF subfamily)